MDGYRRIAGTDRLLRVAGPFLAVVEPIGDGPLASWGYAIWQAGRCVAGRCSPRWGAPEACAAADLRLVDLAEAILAGDDPDGAPVDPVYRILDGAGRRSGPDGDVLLEARDLGALRDCAETVARTNPPGVYPIVVAGDPDPEGVWGELHVEGPDRWEVRGEGVTILPGAFIL